MTPVPAGLGLSDADRQSAWKLDWLTPARCRQILVAFLLISVGSHLLYLHSPACVDLSGDEAQYWDWSRHLDLSYYSKGPLIAYIIHASCAIFGDTMPAVRYPAVLLGAGTSILTYLLARLLFESERMALGATLLFAMVPMFIAGSVLMTIDPPMFFCWAAATYFAARRIYSSRSGGAASMVEWAIAGAFVGVGFLAKYAEFLWFIGLFGFLIMQRRKLTGGIIALVVAAVCTLPVLIWNFQHNWVSLRHVAKQTGANHGSFTFGNVIDMIGGQLGTVGPTMAVLMVAAVIWAWRHRYDLSEPHHGKAMFLAWIGVPFFLLNLLASFRAKVQLNWPAPAYFSLIILTALFLARMLEQPRWWKTWRIFFWLSVAIGLIVMPIAHDTTLLYPILKHLPHQKIKAAISSKASPATSSHAAEPELEDSDPLARLRGWHELGQLVYAERQKMSPGTFVMCDDYMQTAEMAFYQPDHPPTYCAGPYYREHPKRFSQYDMWPDRRLDPSSPLAAHDAIYVGKGGDLPSDIVEAFDHVEKLPELPIRARGALVRTFKLWRCTNFHGMTLPAGLEEY